MATNTSIEWTRGDDGTPGTTWNPILGCSRVSPGCDECYAIPQARIRAANPHPKVAAAFAGLTERTDERLDWTGRVNLLPERLEQPLKWRKPKRVFVNSLADLFHDEVPTDFIVQIFAVMFAAKRHTFQLLTKRHGRMKALLSSERFADDVFDLAHARYGTEDAAWPLPNVWVGVSVENQQWANVRVPALFETPAAIRWLSCEPLVGPVDLTRIARPSRQQPNMVWDALGARYGVPGQWQAGMSRRIDWVVCGGESGAKARPMHPDWARSLRDQCIAADVPYFFKQWGAWAPWFSHPEGEEGPGDTFVNLDGTTGHVWFNEDLGYPTNCTRNWGESSAIVSRVGKKASGRVLDGRTWDEYPQTAAQVAS